MRGHPKVAVFGSFLPQTQGVSLYCSALAEALAQHGPVRAVGFRKMYPAFLFPGQKESHDATYRLPEIPNLTVSHELDYRNPWTWVRAGLRVDAEVAHLQWWSLPLFSIFFTIALLARLRGRKIVVTVHNVQSHEKGRGYRLCTGMICALADAIVVHGATNIENFRRLYPRAHRVPVYEMPHGVFTDPPALRDRAAARQAMTLANDELSILFFGHIRPYKGLDTLLHAFAELRGNTSAKLIVAGQVWDDWGRYQEMIDSLHIGDAVQTRLRYIPQDDVGELFAAADIVVLPYHHFDAQSGVASLAIAYAKPLLVSRVNGLEDCVGRHGDWMIPAGDAHALALRLQAFAADRVRQEAAFAALAESLRQEQSMARVAERLSGIYRALCGEDTA